LGTLGQFGRSSGKSLAIINAGERFRYDGSANVTKRSALLTAPALSLPSTNKRYDQEGYYPSICDKDNLTSCKQLDSFGVTTKDSEEAFKASKSLLLAGFTSLSPSDWPNDCPAPATRCGSVLVTPVGIGKAISNAAVNDGALVGYQPAYCANYKVDNGNYECKNRYSGKDLIYQTPDSEDLVFLFNASKILSGDDAYKVTGFYGGVRRGYIVVDRATLSSGELDVKEIVP
ncbi:MAG: hypothetical protein AAB499_02705, partial [Patescibacteria group bacterium]